MVSSQNAADIRLDEMLTPDVKKHVVDPILEQFEIDSSDYKLLVNPTGRFVVGGRPAALGVVAIGDAHTCTNPLYGRGCSLALVQAELLAEAAAAHPGDAAALLDRTLAAPDPHDREVVETDLVEIDGFADGAAGFVHEGAGQQKQRFLAGKRALGRDPLKAAAPWRKAMALRNRVDVAGQPRPRCPAQPGVGVPEREAAVVGRAGVGAATLAAMPQSARLGQRTPHE